LLLTLKGKNIMRVDLKNSIYQQKKSDSFGGLTVSGGMLINNRPNGITGIAQAAQVRKAMKVAEKVSIISQGNSMGEMMEGSCGH
jgi:hypothetical protein